MDINVREYDNTFELITYAPGDIVFNEGEDGDAAYIIKRGDVEIRKDTMSPVPQTLAKIGFGETFGEMALFDGRPRMASAIAISEVEVIKMPRQAFEERLSTIDPAMKIMVLKLVTRVREMADEFIARDKDPNWGGWKK
ncbi:MAG: cyclic nucleotide-binding domain-containing protein [Magnetovibrio sp.]|nr:cyclic nucleotide-binding domain-containing protein [Magnetovibrio sp.]